MRMPNPRIFLLYLLAYVARGFHVEAGSRGTSLLFAHLEQQQHQQHQQRHHHHQQQQQQPVAPKWDLWVAGAGELGERVARQYASLHPEARIVVETVSRRSLDRFSDLNVHWRLLSERTTADAQSARNLVLSFPPSKNNDFVGEISAACSLWNQRAGGRMLYTSSIGCYGNAAGRLVDEFSDVDPSHSAHTAKLVSAERVVQGEGGTILRLAGLYSAMRGAHCHYLRAATEGRRIDSMADDILHLIHYDDAAALAVTLLESTAEENVFVGVDEAHMTRQEVCDAALACDLFKHAAKPQFLPGRGGKTVDGSWTKQKLRWRPRYPSFRDCMNSLSAARPGHDNSQNR